MIVLFMITNAPFSRQTHGSPHRYRHPPSEKTKIKTIKEPWTQVLHTNLIYDTISYRKGKIHAHRYLKNKFPCFNFMHTP